MPKKNIVIIGAGLTGLSLAHFFIKKGITPIVIDKKDTPGGVINTCQDDDFLYELGPNTGVIASEGLAQLIDDLSDRLETKYASKEVNKRYVCKKGVIKALPMNPIQAAFTPLITWFDKFNILLEPFRKKGSNPNETLAELVKRRMGQSYLDYAIDPFILGIYAGDPNMLVPKYALPKLYNLEQKYGSFVIGAIRKILEKKTELQKKVNKKIFSYPNGLSELINTLADELPEENLILNADAITIHPNNDNYKIVYQQNGNDFSLEADMVIPTVNSKSLPELLPFVNKDILEPITDLEYAKVVQVTLGYKVWNGKKLDGFGALIPFKENRDLLGILFMSSLFPNRAPKEGALLSIFIGGVRRPELTELNDTEITQLAKREVESLLGCSQEPNLIKINRNNAAIPQYYKDSPARFDAISKIEEQYPNLIIAGNSNGGIGMSNRVQQSYDIANKYS